MAKVPVTGYFARRCGHTLAVFPVGNDPQQLVLALRYEMSLDVRLGEAAFPAELQQGLDLRQPQIKAVLKEYSAPLAVRDGPVSLPTADEGRSGKIEAVVDTLRDRTCATSSPGL